MPRCEAKVVRSIKRGEVQEVTGLLVEPPGRNNGEADRKEVR